ncbi:MAG TPA: inositol monophosphatase family protein, partial [Alphaproteobacteria bacterium]|nr:inositol monophosphatase family protein [Alphaproteobacteria bacterium]
MIFVMGYLPSLKSTTVREKSSFSCLKVIFHLFLRPKTPYFFVMSPAAKFEQLAQLLVNTLLTEALPYYTGEKDMQCCDKGGRDGVFNPVTLADKSVQKKVSCALADIFGPAFILEGEETYYDAAKAVKDGRRKCFLIYLDPIDGTTAFSNKKPGWVCQIGWMKGGVPGGSVIVKPLFNENNELQGFTAFAVECGPGAAFQKYKMSFNAKGELENMDELLSPNTHEKVILIQTSGFSEAYAKRLPELWATLENLGYQVVESRSRKAFTGIGTAALDFIAILEGRDAGAIISNNLPHD